MPTFRVPLRCLPAGSVVLLLARHTPCYHGSVPGKQEDKDRTATSRKGTLRPAQKARLGASSLLTSYSVRGGRVCSLKRVDPSKVMSEVSLGGLGLTPRPLSSIGLMASAGRPAAWPRQAEGRTIEVESSSLAPRASPRDRVTTPAGREEPGTSLYPSYNDPPDAPRPRQCQGGHFRHLLHAGIAGSGRIWASQLALQPAWAGPGRGGHRGGRRKQR